MGIAEALLTQLYKPVQHHVDLSRSQQSKHKT